MTKSRSHVHDLRTFIGEEDSASLIKRLNSDPEGDLVHLLDYAECLRDAVLKKPVSEDRRRLAVRCIERINSTLQEFAFSPIFEGISGDRWVIDWGSGNASRRQAAAVLVLLDLAEQGLLHRVRMCANAKCLRWFYARFDHQRFDSEKCQQEVYRADPQWKQKRREYMKKLRQLHKRRG
jgi:hypothetical protein